MPNHQSPARVEARQASPLERARPARGAARAPYRPAGLQLEQLLREEICVQATHCRPFPRDLRMLFIDLQPQRAKPISVALIGTAIACLAQHPKLPPHGLSRIKTLLIAWLESLQLPRNVTVRELFANETRSNAEADIEQTEAIILQDPNEIWQAINATVNAGAHNQQLVSGLIAKHRQVTALQLCGGVA